MYGVRVLEELEDYVPMIEQGCVPLLWLASMASDPFAAKAAAAVFVALRRVTESDKLRQTLVNLVVATGNH